MRTDCVGPHAIVATIGVDARSSLAAGRIDAFIVICHYNPNTPLSTVQIVSLYIRILPRDA